jgi:hypothetical protein
MRITPPNVHGRFTSNGASSPLRGDETIPEAEDAGPRAHPGQHPTPAGGEADVSSPSVEAKPEAEGAPLRAWDAPLPRPRAAGYSPAALGGETEGLPPEHGGGAEGEARRRWGNPRGGRARPPPPAARRPGTPPCGGRNRRSPPRARGRCRGAVGRSSGSPPPRGRCRGRSPKAVGAPPGRPSRSPPPAAECRGRSPNHPGGPPGLLPRRRRCRGRSPKAVGEPPGRPSRSPPPAAEMPRAQPEGGGGTTRAALPVSSPGGGDAEGAARRRWGNTPGARDSPLPRPRAAGYSPRWGEKQKVSPPSAGRCRGRSPKAVREPPGGPPGLLPLGGGAEGAARRRWGNHPGGRGFVSHPARIFEP